MSHLRSLFILSGCIVLALSGALLAAADTTNQAARGPDYQNPVIKILQQSPGSLEVEISFPALEVCPGHKGAFVKMGSLAQKPDASGNLLPVYQILLPGIAGSATTRILKAETATATLKAAPLKIVSDLALAAADATAGMGQKSALNRKSSAGRTAWLRQHSLGAWRGIPLQGLEIDPVRWSASGRQIEYLKSLRIRIEFPAALAPGQAGVALSKKLDWLSKSLPIPVGAKSPPPPPLPNSSVNQTRLKIFVSQEGIYQLSASALASWGVSLGAVDPRTIRLENRGVEQPIYVGGEADGRFDAEDYIEFWGEPLHGTFTDQNPEIYSDLYSDVNVYWLSWGEDLGARLVEESGEVTEVDELKLFRAISYPFTIHQEQNNYFNRLSQVQQDSLKEHWFFDSGIQASQTRNYSVYLPYPDDNALINARVRANLQGLTYPDAYGQGGQHHIYVSLNNENSPALEAGSSGSSWWLGQTGVVLDAQGNNGISATVLDHGANTLSLFCPVDTDAGPNDTVLLNWYEITYQRLYQADADLIHFAPPEAAADTLVDYRIEGFSSSQIDVYKLGQSKITNADVIPYQENNQTRYKLHFQDRPYGFPQYVALTPGAKLVPDSTQLDPGSDLYGQLSSGEALKLLIITHRLFENHPVLEAYIARRQSTLGRTELVYIDDVFDEYSDGIYNPEAIRNLLQSLPTPPEYLLLVGDASYDTRNLYGLNGNLIPAAYVQTKAYGSVASDFWYSLLDGDLVPDLAVGRISCRTPEELTSFLNKLEDYETNAAPGAWRGTHLFVSGTGGTDIMSFLELSQQIISLTPKNVRIERLATDPVSSPYYGGTTDLLDLFDAGALMVDYNGHGAGAVWSDNSLFRLENLPQLSNAGRYPFVTNFTCFIGAFDTPGQGTILGEEFIFAPQKGAIAVLGSTGLGWFINGGWLQEELVKATYEQPNLRLGDLINLAKIAYYAYYGEAWPEESFDTIHLMTLLGDPTLQLALAQVAPAAELTPQFVQVGDSVQIRQAGDYAGYEGVVRVYDGQDYPALEFGEPLETPLSVTAEGLAANLIHPSLPGESISGTYRLFFWEPGSDESYCSAAEFYSQDVYADSVMVDSLTPYPSPVYAQDTFGFRAKILASEGIASAYAHVHIERSDGTVLAANDSLVMNLLGNAWYQTGAVIDSGDYHYAADDSVSVWVKIANLSGDTVSSNDTPFYILDGRADPAWVDDSLKMGVVADQAALIMQIANEGEMEIDSLDVSFYQSDSTLHFLGMSIIHNLLPDSIAQADILSDLPPGMFDFQIRMNDSGWVDDKNNQAPYTASLLIDHFSLSQQFGSKDTIQVGDLFRVYLPGNCLSAPLGVMTLQPRSDFQIPTGQQGLSFALQDSDGVIPGLGLDLGLLGGIALTADSLYIAADLTDYAGTLNPDVYWHEQTEGMQLWSRIESQADTLATEPDPTVRYSARIREPGRYALLQNGDHQGPAIEITVDGQIYTPGGYVPSQAKISAVVQDPGGVNSAVGSYWITVDNVLADTSEVTATAEASGQELSLSINRSFPLGSHSMAVVAEDLFGNAGSATITFQVAGQFHLDFLGNYPNPVKDKSYFAYRLTEQTTEPVQIRIFTVSGRLIRTLHSSSGEEINYGEIYWDGRDEDGENIANGVYFYKFQARRGDHSIERTMKLAKLR